MGYKIKEIYYTLQGEGAQSGRAAVFCRFTGCNLWSGREQDRYAAICSFCDTDFVGMDGVNGGNFKSSEDLALKINEIWHLGGSNTSGVPFVVFTGGEPLLQLDGALVSSMKKSGFQVAIETNGTIIPPEGIDWICMSPKKGSEIILKKGSELKFVYPQQNFDPSQFENFDFEHFYIQPMEDGINTIHNTEAAIEFCLANPKWKLSIQTHKILKIK